jgi:hypothetical protein
MPCIIVRGSPKGDGDRDALLQAAFDEFMTKVPLEQRRFLRRFGYTESEIDRAIRNPEILTWVIQPATGEAMRPPPSGVSQG